MMAAPTAALSASPPSATSISSSSSNQRTLQPMESASHFTAAMQQSDDEYDGEASGDSSRSPRAPSRWSRLPSDLSRLVLSFCCTPRQVWAASRVCREWRRAVDHPATWAALCASNGWELPAAAPSSAAAGRAGVVGVSARSFFIERYRTVRHYSRRNWRQRSWAAHAAGVLHLAVPPPKRFFSWGAGGVAQRVDEQTVVTAASAPTYGLKVWRLNGTGSGGHSNASDSDAPPAECLHELHVYGNPLLAAAHADDGAAAAAAVHPLDPVASGLRSHWSCVDVYTTAGMIDEGDEGDAEAEGAGPYASFEAAAASAASDVGVDGRDLSSASSSSSSSSFGAGHSSGRAVPRPSDFILFAGMQRPLLYLYDLQTRRLRAFRPGHTSAICCVRMGRELGEGAAAGSGAAPLPASFAAVRAPRPRRLCASGGYDHTACVWDVDRGTLVARLRGGCDRTVWCVDVHARGRLLAAGADDGRVRLWRLDRAPGDAEEEDPAEANMSQRERDERKREQKRKEMERLLSHRWQEDEEREDGNQADARPTTSGAAPASSSSSSSTPASSSSTDDAPAAVPAAAAAEPSEFGGTLLLTLEGHTGSPMTLQFDPLRPVDLLWSAGYDRTIRLWDISGAATTAAAAAQKPECLDGALPSVPSAAGACLRVFSGHGGVVFGLVITAHVLVSSSRDGSVRVWERDAVGQEGKCLRVLQANRRSSELTDEISASGVSGEQSSSLSSSRAQQCDIKCAAVTAGGDILTASSDGRVQLFQFERRGGPAQRSHADRDRAARPDRSSLARSSSQGVGGGSGTGAVAAPGGDHSPQQDQGCSIM